MRVPKGEFVCLQHDIEKCAAKKLITPLPRISYTSLSIQRVAAVAYLTESRSGQRLINVGM